MWLDVFLFIAFLIVLIFQLIFLFLPLSNEQSTVRRLPWITFAILAINVIVYFLCLPATVQQDKDQNKAYKELNTYIEKNMEILADARVRDKLRELGIYNLQLDLVEQEFKNAPEMEIDYKAWLLTAEATDMREETYTKIEALRQAMDSHIYAQYGLGRAGKWKAYQMVTYAFMHGNSQLFGIIFPLHLFFNMIALFAVGFSLEDLWGRSTFLLFYLMSAAAACMPDALWGTGLIGASGAVFATMGAFLIRLPRTKVKVGWCVVPPLTILCMIFGRKPFGIVKVPGYLFLSYSLISQLLFWWFINHKLGVSDGVSYRCHIAGFAFGVGFALLLKATRFEEQYIHPKIEAKVSFEASPVVVDALNLVDQGNLSMAERKLKSQLVKLPDDLNTILALIQVYQRSMDYDRLNYMYGRLIRFHLTSQDKEAALYAYDNLLSSFPENELKISIPARDWIAICDYLREAEMNREAGVEYERLVQAHPNDPLTVRACVEGGEASLLAHDNQRALKMFEHADMMHPPITYANRIKAGLDKCKMRLNHHASLVKEPVKHQQVAKDVNKGNLQL